MSKVLHYFITHWPSLYERKTRLDASDRLLVHRDGSNVANYVRPALIVPDGAISSAQLATGTAREKLTHDSGGNSSTTFQQVTTTTQTQKYYLSCGSISANVNVIFGVEIQGYITTNPSITGWFGLESRVNMFVNSTLHYGPVGGIVCSIRANGAAVNDSLSGYVTTTGHFRTSQAGTVICEITGAQSTYNGSGTFNTFFIAARVWWREV